MYDADKFAKQIYDGHVSGQAAIVYNTVYDRKTWELLKETDAIQDKILMHMGFWETRFLASHYRRYMGNV